MILAEVHGSDVGQNQDRAHTGLVCLHTEKQLREVKKPLALFSFLLFWVYI